MFENRSVLHGRLAMGMVQICPIAVGVLFLSSALFHLIEGNVAEELSTAGMFPQFTVQPVAMTLLASEFAASFARSRVDGPGSGGVLVPGVICAVWMC